LPGLVALLLALSPLAVCAQEEIDPVGDAIESTQETIEVKRADTRGPKHESLKFLRDNRVFLRAQLDRLRLQITREDGGAQIIDERFLRLQELSAAIAAASDTIRTGQELAARRDLMQSVTQLGEIETELTLMETLLAEQQRRLIALETDFLGHQETALVIVMRGLAGKHAPAAITIEEDNDVVRVELTPGQRLSLEQGGIAQVFHEFVEPREHVFAVRFEGDAWAGAAPLPVSVEAARDRLTFLELDLSRLDPKQDALGLLITTWYR
jgi:hypothetical protein